MAFTPGSTGSSSPAHENPALGRSCAAGGPAGDLAHGNQFGPVHARDLDFVGFANVDEHHAAGRFPFDKLIRTFKLEQINEAIAAQARGECIKVVLLP